MVTDISRKSRKLKQLIDAAGTIAIIGHIKPDGDCIGSTLGMYNYIMDNFEGKRVDVFTEEFSPEFNFLKGADKILHEHKGGSYDLAISIDVSSEDRLGAFEQLYKSCISTVCIDHHRSNPGFGDLCYIDADGSSACEVMCDLIDTEKISKAAAECIYLGIVHDTGVFKYSSTRRKTMELAGLLLEKGVDSAFIIDETFYKKTYKQNCLMAKAVLGSKVELSGRFISTIITKELFKECKCTTMDTEGIVEQLRLTDGVEVAVLCYQDGKNSYKYSLRSKSVVDVSVIATGYGGGGHIRAAGFNLEDDPAKVISGIKSQVKKQLDKK